MAKKLIGLFDAQGELNSEDIVAAIKKEAEENTGDNADSDHNHTDDQL